MTAPTTARGAGAARSNRIEPHGGGFGRDLVTVAGRALRGALRDPVAVFPALVIPVFFFFVNVGSLESVAQAAGTADYHAFQLPVAIIFAVTGVSRANALVEDIASGYFERLLLTPVNRLALLLGLMVADLALVIALCLPVLALGVATGVSFSTGPLGVLMFVALAGAWGVAFTGFPYAIGLRTGSPGAVAGSFVLFFPFAFLTTAYVPKELLGGWLATAADWNPVTYVLAGLRSLVIDGWDTTALVGSVLATGTVAVISIGLALMALRRRVQTP